MIKSVRVWAMTAALAAALLGAPVSAATITAQVNAKVVKPMTLTAVQDLEMGSIFLAPGTWSGAAVRLSKEGALTCPAPLTCSGLTQPAIYNVTGSAKSTVRVGAPNVTLVNQADPSKTLTLVVDKPSTVYIANSGHPGTNFPLGGTVTLSSDTADGTYVGTFDVTVEY